MKIAICDDDQTFLNMLRNKIAALDISDNMIYEFNSGKKLLETFEKGKYDIIILDVEMPELDGLKTAEHIRKMDQSVILAFLTNYAEFAVQGYEVKAFRYILKSQPDYLYTQQLSSIINEYKQQFRTYCYSNKNMSFTYKLSDILYFEVYNRRIILHTITEDIEFYGTLSEIYDELKEYNFIKPGKSYVVNLQHIKCIHKNNLIMVDHTKILIGRTNKKEVVSQYLKFMSGR